MELRLNVLIPFIKIKKSMNSITVKINDTDYKLKQSFRCYLLFEEMTGKQISDISTMKDTITFLYCTLKGSNIKEWNYSFDEFIDLIDEYPEIFRKFNELNETISSSNEKKTEIKD